MKRAIAIFLVLLMVLTLGSCGQKSENIFDKMYSTFGTNIDDFSDLITLLKEILGEPDEICEPSILNSYSYEFEYEDVELYGYKGLLTVRLANTNVAHVVWFYKYKGTDKKEFESIISSLVKSMNKKYGKHGDGNEYYQYDWKDKSGFCYFLGVDTDRIWVKMDDVRTS